MTLDSVLAPYDIGVREIERLIEKLELDKEILAELDEGKRPPTEAALLVRLPLFRPPCQIQPVLRHFHHAQPIIGQ